MVIEEGMGLQRAGVRGGEYDENTFYETLKELVKCKINKILRKKSK